MDRKLIKETAKNIYSGNKGLYIAVTFVSGLLTSFNSSFSFEVPAQSSSDASSMQTVHNIEDLFASFVELFNTKITAVVLVVIAISIVITSLLKIFVSSTVTVGTCRFFLMNRKGYNLSVAEIFQNFKDKTFLNIAKISFFKNLEIFLWSCLFLFPGIIKSYEYAAVDYILAVNPKIDRKKALELSSRMMYGHKAELWEFHLSFFGWHFLGSFTCGILNIVYVAPYMNLALAEYFSALRVVSIQEGTITEEEFPDYDPYIPPQPVYGYPMYSQPMYYNPTQPPYASGTNKPSEMYPPVNAQQPYNTQPPVQPGFNPYAVNPALYNGYPQGFYPPQAPPMQPQQGYAPAAPVAPPTAQPVAPPVMGSEAVNTPAAVETSVNTEASYATEAAPADASENTKSDND